MQHNWILLDLPDPYPICQCTKCKMAIELHGTEGLEKFIGCPGKIIPLEMPSIQEPDLTPEVERLSITIKMAKRWVAALLKWRKAGYPTRTQKEVARIVPICESNECGHYINGRCSKCGCGVNNNRIAIVNKAKMATEKCPLGKW